MRLSEEEQLEYEQMAEVEYRTPQARQAAEDQISQLMMKLISPGVSNEPQLGVNLLKMETAKRNGYPKHMYHRQLTMVIAINRGQEDMLRGRGFNDKWVAQEYPIHFFRRNLDDKFRCVDAKVHLASCACLGFVETREIKNKAQREAMLREGKIGEMWFDSPALIPAVNADGGEDPALEIARLQGQLEEARRRAEGKPAKS